MRINVEDITITLKNAGFDVFLVGGAVRDIFMGRTPVDFDIATNATPEDVMTLFPTGKRVGASFPVVIVNDVEVATFRTEHATGRKLVEIVLVNTIEEDLSRRDFTMNAMALNPDGILVDPHGGERDIKSNIIRFVGEAEERIVEDPLRMLRAIRFATTLDMVLAVSVMSAISTRNGFKLVKDLSAERIRMEFEKIILSDNPRRGIELLDKSGILDIILPELADTVGIDQNKHHDEPVFEHVLGALDAMAKMNVPDDKKLVMRLAALFHDIGKPSSRRFSTEKNDFTFHGHEGISARMTANIMRRMKFDTKTSAKVVHLVNEHMFFFTEDSRLSRIKVRMASLENVGLEIRDLMRLRLADRKGNLAKATRSKITRSFKRTLANIREVERTDAALKVTDLAINGNDLKVMGFTPGPIFGVILNTLFTEVLEDRLVNEIDVLSDFVNANFA